MNVGLITFKLYIMSVGSGFVTIHKWKWFLHILLLMLQVLQYTLSDYGYSNQAHLLLCEIFIHH